MIVTFYVHQERLKSIQKELPILSVEKANDSNQVRIEIEIKDSMDALRLFHAGFYAGIDFAFKKPTQY